MSSLAARQQHHFRRMFSLASTEAARPRSSSLHRGGLVSSPWTTRRADSASRPLWGALDSRWSSSGSINDDDRFASVDKDLDSDYEDNGWRRTHDHHDRGRGGRRRRDVIAATSVAVAAAAAAPTAADEPRAGGSEDPEAELPSVGDILQTRTVLQAEEAKEIASEERHEQREEEAQMSTRQDQDQVEISPAKDESDAEEERKTEKKEKKAGFRERKIIDYENRIRSYSTPDKIFRYFATYKTTQGEGEVFMTPEDFVRSLTPGARQPEGLGLDQFRKLDLSASAEARPAVAACSLPQDSIFYKLGSAGLISFSDYVFLLTILSTSRRQFEIAFRMFDLNGDGDVDAEEFERVQEIIRQTTSNGRKHRDHANTGNTISKKMNSALANFFFGEDLSGKLTIDRFLAFQTQLQHEILALEFARKQPDARGRISEKQLAELLIEYADYPQKKRKAVIKRVKKAYGSSEDGEQEGIALDDYINIFLVLMHIEDVEQALSFYTLAGASVDRDMLAHVAKVCTGAMLSDHVVDVIFTIFDEDGDGGLSNREFIAVMKNKLNRGLEKPKDTGVINLLAAVVKCAANTKAL